MYLKSILNRPSSGYHKNQKAVLHDRGRRLKPGKVRKIDWKVDSGMGFYMGLIIIGKIRGTPIINSLNHP